MIGRPARGRGSVAPGYTRFMPSVVECGKLQFSSEEAAAYRARASRLREACEMALDLEAKPGSGKPLARCEFEIALRHHI
jgi:hypothetical protein